METSVRGGRRHQMWGGRGACCYPSQQAPPRLILLHSMPSQGSSWAGQMGAKPQPGTGITSVLGMGTPRQCHSALLVQHLCPPGRLSLLWSQHPALRAVGTTQEGDQAPSSHALHPRFGQPYQASLTPGVPSTPGSGCLPHILILPGRYFLLLPPRIPLPPSPFSVSLISANGKWAPSLLGKLPGGCRPGTGYKLPLESLRGGGGWYPVVLDLSVPAQQSSASAREPTQASAIPGPVPFSLPRDRGVSAPLMPRREGFSISAHHLIINLRHRDGRGITDRR